MQYLCDSLDIWSEALKSIQGKCGSCVASFFYLTKSLFVFYLIPSVLSLSFLYIPLLRNRALLSNSSNGTINSTDSLNSTIWHWYDIFAGTGWVGDSALFYGAYPADDALPDYSIQLAYGLLMVGIFVSCGFRTFLLGQRYFSRAIHFQMLSDSGLSKLLFAGWDYSIVDGHMAQLQKRANLNRVTEKLEKHGRDRERNCAFYGEAVSIWSVCLLLTGCSCYFLIWLGETNYRNYLFICREYTVFGCLDANRVAIVLPLTCATISTILARLFSAMSKLERHLRPGIGKGTE